MQVIIAGESYHEIIFVTNGSKKVCKYESVPVDELLRGSSKALAKEGQFKEIQN